MPSSARTRSRACWASTRCFTCSSSPVAWPSRWSSGSGCSPSRAARPAWYNREMSTLRPQRAYICCGPDCTARRSPALLDLLEREVAAAGLGDAVEVLPSGCMKHCERGPSMVIQPSTIYYEQVDPARLRTIVRRHLREGLPIPEWFYHDPATAPMPAPRPVPPSALPRPVPSTRPAQPASPALGKKPRRPAPDVDDFKW